MDLLEEKRIEDLAWSVIGTDLSHATNLILKSGLQTKIVRSLKDIDSTLPKFDTIILVVSSENKVKTARIG